MAPSSSNNTSQLSQTHPYTGDRDYHAWCHLLIRSDDHSYTIGRATKSKLGFSIWTQTTDLPIGVQLYLLSHSSPRSKQFVNKDNIRYSQLQLIESFHILGLK